MSWLHVGSDVQVALLVQTLLVQADTPENIVLVEITASFFLIVSRSVVS
jgi:hypothetical protein